MKKSTKILLTLLCVMLLSSFPFFLSSGALLGSVSYDLNDQTDTDEGEEWDFSKLLFPSAQAEEVHYELPVDFTAGKKPNPALFTENGYQDDSITVQMETRELENVTYCLAFVTVKSPTQLRTGIAGPSVKSTKVANISSMAEKHNAIIAINADYFTNNPTKTSFEYRMGQKIRSKGNKTKDILIIDENGDFNLFVKSNAEKMKAFQASGKKVINAFTFGPALVIDSEVQKVDTKYGYNPNGKEPRMAIGQMGELSYVLVMAEGRTENSKGVTHQELADYMGELGCTQAFNLDGGNSAVMVYNGAFYGARTGNERAQSDMIYFASAVPEENWEK